MTNNLSVVSFVPFVAFVCLLKSVKFFAHFLKVVIDKGIRRMAMCVSWVSCLSCIFLQIFYSLYGADSNSKEFPRGSFVGDDARIEARVSGIEARWKPPLPNPLPQGERE
jgi:hypothetical protein